MKDYRQTSNTNRKSGYKNRRGIGILGDERPTMYKAKCDNCGNNCEVPFKPSNGKPVYCNDCFRTKRDDADNNHRSSRDSHSGEKRMFSAICDSCGRSCEVPFKPSNSKPVFCSDCFESRGSNADGRPKEANNDLREQLAVINAKLDKLMKAVEMKGKPPKALLSIQATDPVETAGGGAKRIRKNAKPVDLIQALNEADE